MALGHLLCVSWIFVLLFDANAGLPSKKGYGYPHMSDMHNIDDEGDDDVWTSSTTESHGPALNYGVYTSHNKPQVTQNTISVPAQHKRLNAPSIHVERLVNGGPRDWGLENHDKPLILPLRSNFQPSYPGNSIHAFPSSTDGATHYASSSAYSDPASSRTSQPEKTPRFDYGPVGSGHGGIDFNTGSSAHGSDSSNMPHLVYEDVFHHPSENTQASIPSHACISHVGGHSRDHYEGAWEPSFPSYQPNVGAQPVAASGKGSASSAYQAKNVKASPQHPQKPVVSQRVSDPILRRPPPPSASSYIIQTRNGFQRVGHLHTYSNYAPEFPAPMPVSSPSVKKPASYPAAPKAVKNQ